jgi:hypothetical protein
VPYAFSHRHAAFYWTEDDARENYKLNIWAKPPCLNCEVAGENYSRRCDIYEKQEDSEGQIQCCSRCKRKGDDWSCIEQLEIRADGNYGRVVRQSVEKEDHVDSKEAATPENVDYITVEFNQWCREEQELRKNGLSWWEPINLECGDVDRKEEIVEQWKQRDARPGFPSTQTNTGKLSWKKLKQIASSQWGRPTEQLDSDKASWENGRALKQALQERMSLCKQINEELVAEWNMEEGDLKREAEQAEEDALTRQLQPDDDLGVFELERETNYWSEKIRIERIQQYHKEVTEVGQEVAELSQRAWEAREGEVVSQACHFLGRKQYWMSSGLGEQDAITLSMAELWGELDGGSDSVNDLEDLVPQIFRAGV